MTYSYEDWVEEEKIKNGSEEKINGHPDAMTYKEIGLWREYVLKVPHNPFKKQVGMENALPMPDFKIEHRVIEEQFEEVNGYSCKNVIEDLINPKIEPKKTWYKKVFSYIKYHFYIIPSCMIKLFLILRKTK